MIFGCRDTYSAAKEVSILLKFLSLNECAEYVLFVYDNDNDVLFYYLIPTTILLLLVEPIEWNGMSSCMLMPSDISIYIYIQ